MTALSPITANPAMATTMNGMAWYMNAEPASACKISAAAGAIDFSPTYYAQMPSNLWSNPKFFFFTNCGGGLGIQNL